MSLKKKRIKKGIAIPFPIFAEIAYRRDLLAYVREVKTLVINNLIENQTFISSYKYSIRKDDISDELENALKVISFYALTKVSGLIGSLINRAKSVNQFNRNVFAKFIQSVPENNQNIIDEMKLWAMENARLIKTIPERMLDKVAEIVYGSVRSGESSRSLAIKLREAFDISKNRAKIIARDQISKLNGNITRARNLSLGITEYQWLTSRDERVRHSHDVLESKICSWNNAEVYKNNINDDSWKKRLSIKATDTHPSQDIMCRCTSIAIIPMELAA
jgi:SPP1 gp7 family putative phage head morphogenesis protein